MISISSQQCNLLNEAPAITKLHKLWSKRGCSFEWKMGETPKVARSGKTSTSTKDNSVLLVVSRLSSYSSSILSSTSRPTDQSNYSRNLGTSSDPVTTPKWQACIPMLTELDKQTTRKPWTSKRDEQGRFNARQAHVLAHWFEREKSDSEGDASEVERQKRKHSVHAFFRKNQMRSILRTEKYGDLTTAEHKIVIEGRESRNNHRYAVVVQVSRRSVESVSNQNFTADGEEFTKVLGGVAVAKEKGWTRSIYSAFGKSCEELSWNHRTSTLFSITNKRNSRTSFTDQ